MPHRCHMHHGGRRLHDCCALSLRPSNNKTCSSCDSQRNEVPALPPLVCRLLLPPQSFCALRVVCVLVCLCVCSLHSGTARWSSRGFCEASRSRRRLHMKIERGRMMRRSSSEEDNKNGRQESGTVAIAGFHPVAPLRRWRQTAFVATADTSAQPAASSVSKTVGVLVRNEGGRKRKEARWLGEGRGGNECVAYRK